MPALAGAAVSVPFAFGADEFVLKSAGMSRICRRVPSHELMTKVSALMSPNLMNSWIAPIVVGPYKCSLVTSTNQSIASCGTIGAFSHAN